LWLIVVLAPPWFVDDESLEGLKAQNEVRTTLLQGLAGSVLLVGAYFTWRQLRTTREGQITERYTRAIDQLGHAELDVRLGGIYALERIARDSQPDRATIAEVLSAFARVRAPWPSDAPLTARVLRDRMPDVHAAVNVLSRLQLEGVPRIDLSGIDLRGVTVDGSLRKANLINTNLQFGILNGVDIRDAWLNVADLREAILSGADLREAALADADLREPDLCGADLRGVIFGGAKYQDAVMDAQTRWPDHFDPVAAGVRSWRADQVAEQVADDGEERHAGGGESGVIGRP
jgi:hypothetical protein